MRVDMRNVLKMRTLVAACTVLAARNVVFFEMVVKLGAA